MESLKENLYEWKKFDVVRDSFGSDYGKFKRRVKEILETSEFIVGSPKFINQVLNDYTKKTSEELTYYKKEIRTMINKIKKEEKERGERKNKKLIRSADIAQRQRMRRAGEHPEDYNQQ